MFATAVAAASTLLGTDFDGAKLALLGTIACLDKTLLLLGSVVLLLAHNTTILVLDQILLRQLSTGFVRSSVKNLGARTFQNFKSGSIHNIMSIGIFRITRHYKLCGENKFYLLKYKFFRNDSSFSKNLVFHPVVLLSFLKK